MMRRVTITTLLLGITVAMLTAQQPAPPQPGVATPGMPVPGQPGRTPPRVGRPGEDPQKGTAVLRGYVTAADTGNPVRRALVRAMSDDGRSGGMATTDPDGRFEIRDLLGGRYSLMVTKAGYVSMSYGQRRPEQQGTMLEIPDGATVDKIAFSLPRGGVITGVVLDEFGDPVAGAVVNALRYRYMGGTRRLTPSGGGSTDDRGMFRIFGLSPAEYYVSASLRTPLAMNMGPASASSGPVDGYAPTYYPGTPNPAEASRVTVRAGAETSNISMALISARLARIRGRALSSRGTPVVQGFVNITPVDRSMSMMMMASAMTAADGSFQLVGIPPGEHIVTLRPRGMPTADAEFAIVRVNVTTGDVDNLLLTAAPGAVARGIVTTDEGTPPPMQPQQVTIFARPVTPDPVPMFGNARVNDDWTFELTGLVDARQFSVGVAQNPDWALKAVYHEGVDVTDTPIEFVPGQNVEGFNIVLTRRLTEISGQILGERNAPDTDATVVVFSENPDRWTFGSRYVRTARPNQEGRYTLRGMPPHDYLVLAVKDLEPGQFQDPEFLDSVRGIAERVRLNDAQTVVQDLKVVSRQ